MTTNQMQQWLARAAEELGVRALIGYVVTLSDGRQLLSQALFPDFGSALGTLVFRSQDEIDAGIRYQLLAMGFGMSTFSEPLQNEEFDIDSYREMLSEWGWTSEGRKRPDWLR
jgi:hypothetical protein